MANVLYIDLLKNFFKNNPKFNINNICVVGSGSLAAHNIRLNNDIDIVCVSQYRQLLKQQLKKQKLHDKIDVVKEHWAFFDSNLTDQKIINDINNHFLFCGVKFVSLELLYKRKIKQNRKKDIEDLQKMRDYFDSTNNT